MEVQKEKNFRNCDQGEIPAAGREHYRKVRARQAPGYVRRMKAKYLTFDKPLNPWEASCPPICKPGLLPGARYGQR